MEALAARLGGATTRTSPAPFQPIGAQDRSQRTNHRPGNAATRSSLSAELRVRDTVDCDTDRQSGVAAKKLELDCSIVFETWCKISLF